MLFTLSPNDQFYRNVINLCDNMLVNSRSNSLNHTVDSNGCLKVEFDIPGIKREDLEITVENDEKLKLSWTRNSRNHNETILISKKYDVHTTVASLEHGVLTLIIKPYQSSKPKRIELT